ncbi:MAG: phosphoribosyltransferase family protein [Pseudomonadota bacterium]
MREYNDLIDRMRSHPALGAMQKTVLTAQGLLEDSFRLGVKVLDSGFRPTMIIAIWRGGTPVGMAVQELLAYAGVDSDHIAIRTSSYTGVDQRDNKVAIHGLDYIINKITVDDRVLIVDDVFDTGNTIAAVIAEMERRARDNMARDVRIAVPWFKPARNQTSITPEYFVHETDEWLVFPHELDALDADELRAERPDLAAVIQAATAS